MLRVVNNKRLHLAVTRSTGTELICWLFTASRHLVSNMYSNVNVMRYTRLVIFQLTLEVSILAAELIG
jgi:hypothetical protein